MGHFVSAAHLSIRFIRSLSPSKVDNRVKERLFSQLNAEERVLFNQQARIDQEHSLRSVQWIYKNGYEHLHQDLVVAAALHDVGKSQSKLGVPGRVAATLIAAVYGLGRVHVWAAKKRQGVVLQRIAVYLAHPERGAQILQQAGSNQLVIAWARDHHKEEYDSNIDREIFKVLSGADKA